MSEPSAVSLAREARRFVHLHAQGFPVPEVIAATDEWILLEDVGPSVRWAFGKADVGEIAGHLFQLLASLHAAGYWHGGAQARNFTRDANGRFAMIDMEVGLPAGTPLQTSQARDVFLLVQSLVEWVEPARLHVLLGGYVSQCGRGALDESAATVSWLTRGGWKLIPGGDARRARAAAAVLNTST